MKKQLRPPENWQDFESLCKKLFGEIWGIPHTIKKNGRLGQDQSGIDILGIPKGHYKYWGIQCKGKDLYTHKKLTKTEVDKEIEKANNYQLELETFIIATTAIKDAGIESYVNIKNLESLSKGHFQIILFSWEDLVDLIDENRETYNWYLNIHQFRETFDVNINVRTGKENNLLKPKFKKINVLNAFVEDENLLTPVKIQNLTSIIPRIDIGYAYPIFGNRSLKNHSFSYIEVQIQNSGSSVLEEWKLDMYFKRGVRSIEDKWSSDWLSRAVAIKEKNISPISINHKDKSLRFAPLITTPIIQKDGRSFGVYILAEHEAEEINIEWHFLAKNFDLEGKLNLQVSPIYTEEYIRNLVGNEKLRGIGTPIYEDIIKTYRPGEEEE